MNKRKLQHKWMIFKIKLRKLFMTKQYNWCNICYNQLKCDKIKCDKFLCNLDENKVCCAFNIADSIEEAKDLCPLPECIKIMNQFTYIANNPKRGKQQ